MINLSNDSVFIKIDPKGAELQSIQYNRLEYMWSGDAAFWGKYSPVLFPIVGTLKNDTYCYQGKEYHLPRHGFAREKEFEVNVESNSKATFTLVSNEDTLKVYPFEFELSLVYEIIGNKVSCTYIVKNNGKEQMLFSIGAHPAFAVPLDEELSYDDYYLKFNKQNDLVRYRLDNGLIAKETQTVMLTDHKLPLTKSLFYEDAIVLKHLKSNAISLASQKSEHGLHFLFEDFPFFGIWAAKGAPFVCLEPWCGIADSVDHNQELKDKEGIEKLEAGASCQRSWQVELF
jgi:galactose mutarotase-like enzyme